MSWFVTPWGGPVCGVANAHQSWERREGVLVVLRDGVQPSFGEASPLPGFGSDTLNAARAALDPERLPAPVDDPDAVEALLQTLPSPSARFAIETALLGRIANRRGLPLARLLGAAETRAARSVLAGGLLAPELIETARRHVARGALTLKLKASGRDLNEESRHLAELRRALGPAVALRLDLNGALDAGAAREALALYARHDVELCEEPASGDELLRLAAEATPWFADESALSSEMFEALLAAPGCAGFVLKPTLLGGLRATLRRAQRARASGKAAVVSHAFEGPVALAAAAELALALGGARAHGLDRHAALAAFPRLELPQLPESAPLVIAASGSPGLGARLEGPWDSR